MGDHGPRFPQEIFEHFIDESSDSKESLKKLSLVARSWYQHARKHLFRCFRVRPLRIRIEMDPEVFEQSCRWLLYERRIMDRIKGLDVDPRGFEGHQDVHDKCIQLSHPWLQQDIFPSNQCHFLVFEWRESSTFLKVLQSSQSPGFTKVFLGNVNLGRDDEGVSNLFEHLITLAPSLDTLCLSGAYAGGLWGTKITNRDPAGLLNLQEALKRLSDKFSFRGKTIVLKRFLLRDQLHLPQNRVLEVVIFESVYLNFSHLEHLAIDSSIITLLIGRPHVLRNVKHLSLFDKEPDYMPDVWAYNKVQLHLPSLMSLQLIIRQSQNLIALCRLVLGPSLVACGRSHAMEYPGFQYYTDFTRQVPADPFYTHPRVEHLHVEFNFQESRTIPAFDGELTARIDSMLYSYLDENGGSLKSITAWGVDAMERLPQTANSGRLREGRGHLWWDTAYW